MELSSSPRPLGVGDIDKRTGTALNQTKALLAS